jgi:hypothetical protein
MRESSGKRIHKFAKAVRLMRRKIQALRQREKGLHQERDREDLHTAGAMGYLIWREQQDADLSDAEAFAPFRNHRIPFLAGRGFLLETRPAFFLVRILPQSPYQRKPTWNP